MRRHRGASAGAAIGLGVFLALPAVSLASAAQQHAPGHQEVKTHAGLPAETGELYGIATTRGGDAWAVGYSGVLPHSKALVLFWNGNRWETVPTRSAPGAQLRGVAASSPVDVWAVGSIGQGTANSKTLILHRNGGKWRQMPSTAGTLSGVAAISSRNAWAVGTTNRDHTLILHWNGRKWQQMPSTAGTLSGVAAISSRNAWAVGATNSQKTLILHWNGKSWRQTPSPSVGSDQGLASFLGGVAVSSGHTVWAVGEGDDCGCGPGVSLIERWNGKKWSQVRTSTLSGNMNLAGIASIASRRAWAVGLRGGGDAPTSSAILQWNGSRWVVVPIPGLRGDHGGLLGVAASAHSNAWAVGWESAGGSAAADSAQTETPDIAILHWNGSTWTPMTTVAPAAIPAPAAATTTTTSLAPTTTTTTTTATTTIPSTPAVGAPLLGSAAWGQALGPYSGISGFGEVAPSAITVSGTAGGGTQVESISWSNWGAAEATGQGQSIDGNGQTGPVSSWPLKPVTVVAFNLGNCAGGPPAYEEVTWYFPGDGQTFNPNTATNACTGS